MTAYELMIKTNHFLIKGGLLTEPQRLTIVHGLMAARTTPEQAKRFYTGVKFPDNTDASGRQMYPLYFIPPYHDGKKYQTILNQTPKTHILSANQYELEILRLLFLLDRENAEVIAMVNRTLERLKTTCFGNEDDGVGECFDTSLIVLRFLAATSPDDRPWIMSRISTYNTHRQDKKRPWFAEWYYWLCLSELPFALAKPEIDRYQGEMLNWLTAKSCVMNSDTDKNLHPVLFCILRNAVSKYPDFAYIKNRDPFVSEKDGRLHFDMTPPMTL